MCYKIQYETFFDAKKELRLIGKTDSRFFKNTVYQCEECGLFHHTSNKLKKQKKHKKLKIKNNIRTKNPYELFQIKLYSIIYTSKKSKNLSYKQ